METTTTMLTTERAADRPDLEPKFYCERCGEALTELYPDRTHFTCSVCLEREKKMEKYSDVNFEYPACGGVEVKKGRKYWTVTTMSNYEGSYTNRVHRLPITGTETAEDVYASFYDHRGGFELVKKGFIVQ